MALRAVTFLVTPALAKRHLVTGDTGARELELEPIGAGAAGTCAASCARASWQFAAGTALAHDPVSPAFGQWSPEPGSGFRVRTQQGDTMNSTIHNLKKREGFTLIELMIVVAIIGILAAIAIPNFIKFQLRAKAGESKVNLAGIRTAEESYFADAGTYLDFPETPAAFGGQLKVPFNAAGCPAPLPAFTAGSDGFCWIGWQPEGDVYYSYELIANVASPASSNQFAIGAAADIDGDTNVNSWGLNQPDITGVAMLPAALTFGSAVCNTLGPVTVDAAGVVTSVLGQVAPCEEIDMGRNTF